MKKKPKQTSAYSWLFLTALCAVIFAFFFPLLSGKNFIWFDFINQHIPRNLYIARQLANLNLPHWDTTAYGGCPFLADPENAVFYPFTFLLTFAPNNLLALQFIVFIETLFAAILSFFCLKELKTKNSVAVFGALAFVLSTPFVCRFMNYGHFTVIVFIPAVVLFLLKWSREKKLNYPLGAGVMLGLAFLGGNPQYMYFLCMVVFIHFLCEIGFEIKNKSLGKNLLILFLGYIVIAAVALGIAAINLIPIAEFFSIAGRGTENIAKGTGTPIKNFITLIIPYFYGKVAGAPAPYWGKDGFWNYWEFSQYVGILPLMLALAAPFVVRDKRAVFFGVLIAFSWVYAYGENNPIPQIIPFGKSLRIPSKFFVFTGFSLAMLAGMSLEQILYNETMIKKVKKIFFAFLIIGFVILIYGFIFKAKTIGKIPVDLIQKTQSGGVKVAGLLIVLSALLVLLSEKFKNKIPKISLAVPFILLLVCDDFYFNKNFNSSQSDPRKIYPNIYQISQLKNEQDENFFRIDGGPFTSGNLKALYYGLNTLDGFAALTAENVLNFRKLRGKNKKIFNLLYGVKYEFKIIPPGRLSLRRIPHFAPKAFVVRKLVKLPKDEVVNYLASTNFNPKVEAVIFEGEQKSFPKSDQKDIIKIKEYLPEKIVITAKMASPGILVLSENALPGWSVFVDGNQQKMLIVNQCFRAVELNKGEHKIVWKYSTPGLKLGAIISGITILLVGVLLFFKKHLI